MRWLFLRLALCVLPCVVCLDSDDHQGITSTTPGATNSTTSPPLRRDEVASIAPSLLLHDAANVTELRVAVPTLPYDDDEATKARSLNFTRSDTSNTVENKTSPLDDLSLDDIPMLTTNVSGASTTTTSKPSTQPRTDDCVEPDGRRFTPGEAFSRGCEENCRCVSGRAVCEPRCERPLMRKGAAVKDASCEERAVDECCSQLVCSHDTEPEPLVGCTHKNQTFHHGEMFNDGCEAVCSCGDRGSVQCKPRCPQQMHNSTSDKCVPVPDPNDPCCSVVLCDVTLGDHDVNKISTEEPTDSQIRLKSADALNSTTAIIHFLGEPELDSNLTAEVSTDKWSWHKAELEGVIVHGLEAGLTYNIRVVSAGLTSNAVVITLPKETPTVMDQMDSDSFKNITTTSSMAEDNVFKSGICMFKGHNYTLGQEFNMGCESFCICTDEGVDCSPIECPSEYGLELLDPTCVQWETKPRDFNPTPPNCCPDHARCLNNGSCQYMGHAFDNWVEIPSTLTGCDKKCYCELGNVTCQSLCPPVPATPPEELPCSANEAVLHHLPQDDCCLFWVCSQHIRPGLNLNATHKPDENSTSSHPQHPHHNILAPFGLDEMGRPTEPPLPGPVVLPHPGKDTSQIPGPPYREHHNTQGFKVSKDEGIHGPPPFVVKPGKEDKKKFSKPGKVFRPTIPPDDDYDEQEEGDHPLYHDHQVIYVNQPPTPGQQPNDIFFNKPHHPTGDEEAILHYHTQELPDDPRILAKELLAHLKNNQQHHLDQVFSHGGAHDGPPRQNHSDWGSGLPFESPNASHPQPRPTSHPSEDVQVQLLEPIDEHTIRLAFSVPTILVGLHGRVEVRYTSTKHNDNPSTWDIQVLAPPADLIATPQLHFDLGNLLPDTTYYILITIILRDLSNKPQSRVMSVRTLPSAGTTLPPQIPVDPALVAAVVNATWVQLNWRKFTDFELHFIDGLQLRYREQDGKVFSATPLLHRSVTSYTIEDLKPNVQYEVGLFFIPFPGQTTELQSESNIDVTTTLENDPYKFDIHLEIVAVKSTTVEVTWAGVPYPEDKFVHIYRVIYQSETGKEDFNSFKVAKRDSTPKIVITDLKPITRYRLWLEAYMTNGRTKKSNVRDFVSKSGATVSAGHPHPGLNEVSEGKLSGNRASAIEPGDYYGPLVAVAILAALAIMAALILLLVLMRKNGQNKAAITSSRKTQSAYDNPSYKTCENDPQSPVTGNANIANGNGVSREHSTDETA